MVANLNIVCVFAGIAGMQLCHLSMGYKCTGWVASIVFSERWPMFQVLLSLLYLVENLLFE